IIYVYKVLKYNMGFCEEFLKMRKGNPGNLLYLLSKSQVIFNRALISMFLYLPGGILFLAAYITRIPSKI
ncbi:MAG: hypothetical protein WCP55_14150, partial [Lentisphaerota bacterium]